MKIEMGESLFYSWLRHVKECQIVQTNWKTSSKWSLQYEDILNSLMTYTDSFYNKKYGYKIFKKTASLSQLLQQAECDALGISIPDQKIYAVDVAFHEAGLNYGDREITVCKIITKCLRTALCLYGYLGSKDAEIIFATPKIHNKVLNDLLPCIEDLQRIVNEYSLDFRFRIIVNNDFYDLILKPILIISEGVADTNELFMRSYQMIKMFSEKRTSLPMQLTDDIKEHIIPENKDTYSELKIGKLVQIVLKRILESGSVSQEEIANLQNPSYSKDVFGINYPLLVKHDIPFEKVRYYKTPICINGVKYMLCSQWFEVPTNNDRPYLIKWISEHENGSTLYNNK